MGSSRRERLRRKREEAKRKAEQEKKRAEPEEAKEPRKDIKYAASRRKATMFVEALDREVTFTALSVGQFAEVREEALRHYRRERLGQMMDELELLRDRGMLDSKGFSDELKKAREDVRSISFDDLPEKSGQLNDQKFTKLPYEQYFMAATFEGQAFAIYVSAKTYCKDIKLADIQRIADTAPDEFVEIGEVVTEISKSAIAKK